LWFSNISIKKGEKMVVIYPTKTFKKDNLKYGEVWPPNKKKLHCGVDVDTNKAGTKVVAINDGVVKHVNTMDMWDSVVCIEHTSQTSKNKYTSVYWHIEKLKVREESKVKKGDELGVIGKNNGLVPYRDHLHFGIRYAPFDPVMSVKGALNKNQFPENFRNPVEFLDRYKDPI
jgi:murein DD-endopeptidase MepM/ murein hydrolase activator NlpD